MKRDTPKTHFAKSAAVSSMPRSRNATGSLVNFTTTSDNSSPWRALKSNLADLSDQISTISNTTREISHGLYPSQLEYLGLASAVRRVCHEIGHGKQISIQLAVNDLPHLQPSISLCLYRVTQEALHNVIRHSLANTVQVELGGDDQRVLLRITDDGVGFDLSRQTEGLGLHSMRERIRSVGGTIEIVSAPKNGTRIEVQVNFRQGGPEGSLSA